MSVATRRSVGMNVLIFGLVSTLAIFFLNEEASAKTFVDPRTGCKVIDPDNKPTRMYWSGLCKNGFADGIGRIEFHGNGVLTIIDVGRRGLTMKSGKLVPVLDQPDINFKVVRCDKGNVGIDASVLHDIYIIWDTVIKRIADLSESFAVSKCSHAVSGSQVEMRVYVQHARGARGLTVSWDFGIDHIENMSKPNWEGYNLRNNTEYKYQQKIEKRIISDRVAARKAREKIELERKKAELERKKSEAEKQWALYMAKIFDSRKPIEKIADAVAYDKTRFILEFSDEREILIPYNNPSFVGGNNIIEFRYSKTDIFEDIEKTGSSGFSWQKWFDATQGYAGGSYRVTCVIEPSDAKGLVDGQSYVFDATLQQLTDDRILFKCDR